MKFNKQTFFFFMKCDTLLDVIMIAFFFWIVIPASLLESVEFKK